MNPTTLSQMQFAITTIYHFLFVPLTLGLSIFVAVLETIYVATGNEMYKRMTKFWGTLFLINFAMGVVTGIVQEFQFGMNWASYSRFVGDIFGVPLAIEALLAFFLESTFLGIWLFGWDKLPKKLHAATIWLVAIGSNLSAFWILLANSFMQSPKGFVVEGGRAVMTDFGALLTNPYLWSQFPHTVFSGFTTAGFFIIGISAYHLIRKKEVQVFTTSMRLGVIFSVVSLVGVGLLGHAQMQELFNRQPMKAAAAEAILTTNTDGGLSVFTIIDQDNMKEIVNIRVPYLLSLLAYNRLDGVTRGVTEVQAEYEGLYGPGNYIPSITTAYWAFRVMVGLGTVMLFVLIPLAFLTLKKISYDKMPFFKLVPWVLLMPYVANTAGWILTEMGRQPWVVFTVLKTADAISPNLTGGMVLTSMIGFTLVYGVLMIADIYLLMKYAKAGPESSPALEIYPAPVSE